MIGRQGARPVHASPSAAKCSGDARGVEGRVATRIGTPPDAGLNPGGEAPGPSARKEGKKTPLPAANAPALRSPACRHAATAAILPTAHSRMIGPTGRPWPDAARAAAAPGSAQLLRMCQPHNGPARGGGCGTPEHPLDLAGDEANVSQNPSTLRRPARRAAQRRKHVVPHVRRSRRARPGETPAGKAWSQEGVNERHRPLAPKPPVRRAASIASGRESSPYTRLSLHL